MSENKENLTKTNDQTSSFDHKDIEKNKVISLFAYLGILILIPLLGAKDSKYARFHCNQGLILLIASVAWSIIYGILTAIFSAVLVSGSGNGLGLYTVIVTILGIVSLVFFILAIVGIVNAVTGKAKELPIIGKYKILK